MNGGKLGTIIFPLLTTQQVITAETEKQSYFVLIFRIKIGLGSLFLYVWFVIPVIAVEVLWFSSCFLGVTLYICKIKPRVFKKKNI